MATSGTLVRPSQMGDAEWAWWQDWWEEDYSWDSANLGELRLESERVPPEATRLGFSKLHSAGGFLVESPDGVLFHIGFIPRFWRDGSPTLLESDPSSVFNLAKSAFGVIAPSNSMFRGVTSTIAFLYQSMTRVRDTLSVKGCFFSDGVAVCFPTHYPIVDISGCLISDLRFDSSTAEIQFEFSNHPKPNVFAGGKAKGLSGKASVHFRGVTFKSTLWLCDVNIDSDLKFEGCIFQSPVILGLEGFEPLERVLHGALKFSDCQFDGRVEARSAKPLLGLGIYSCVVKGEFLADTLEFIPEYDARNAFSGTTFEKMVICHSDKSWQLITCFSSSILKGGVDFNLNSARPSNIFFDAIEFGNLAAERFELPYLFPAKASMGKRGSTSVSDGKSKICNFYAPLTLLIKRRASRGDVIERQDRLKQFLRGARNLRVATASIGNKQLEAHFSAFELATRQRLSTTDWPERFVSILYGLVSEYGYSISRPLIAWGVTIVIFGLLFAGINEAGAPLSFQGPMSFREIAEGFAYALGKPLPGNSWASLLSPSSLLRDAHTEHFSLRFLILFLGFIETIIVAVLAFLFGLAIRRRFQIGS